MRQKHLNISAHITLKFANLIICTIKKKTHIIYENPVAPRIYVNWIGRKLSLQKGKFIPSMKLLKMHI